MKRVLLIFGALAATITASAQNCRMQRYNHGAAEPTVYIISVSETDTISCYPQGCNQQDIAMKNCAVRAAIDDHQNATRKGYQQVAMPSAIFRPIFPPQPTRIISVIFSLPINFILRVRVFLVLLLKRLLQNRSWEQGAF